MLYAIVTDMQAKSRGEADPYLAAGAWSNVTVKPFRRGFPK